MSEQTTGDLELRLARKESFTSEIAAFTFVPADGTELPRWQPGAHISIALPDGQRRAYSLCGSGDDANSWTVAVLREPDGRGGSLMMHDALCEGDVVRAAPPRNTFELRSAEHYLFIGGGIGITPLLPMIEEVGSRGATWRLIYLVRERRNAVFLERLERVAGGTVDLWVDAEHGLYDLDRLPELVGDGTTIYACGPSGLLAALQGRWPEDRLHVEHFSGEEVDTTGDRPFDVVLAQSGATVRVEPGVSILEAIEAADPSIDVLQSCHEGVCGSCQTAVLEGEPDHRDLVLTERQKERGDCMMLCVSRATSERLVLDL